MSQLKTNVEIRYESETDDFILHLHDDSTSMSIFGRLVTEELVDPTEPAVVVDRGLTHGMLFYPKQYNERLWNLVDNFVSHAGDLIDAGLEDEIRPFTESIVLYD